jgi:NCAIR mutase (PurE)-related protein
MQKNERSSMLVETHTTQKTKLEEDTIIMVEAGSQATLSLVVASPVDSPLAAVAVEAEVEVEVEVVNSFISSLTCEESVSSTRH